MALELELKPIKSIYGTPWSKLAKGIRLSRGVMNKLGKIIVREIVKEARKDFAKQGKKPTPEGEPEGIPKSRDFFKSFKFRIRGSKTVEVYSTWPWIDQILEGRGPYRMNWLTQRRGVPRVPMKQPSGVTLIRVTPTDATDAWIHPGFAKHNFIERGIQKGREKAAKIMLEETAKQLAKGDPTR